MKTIEPPDSHHLSSAIGWLGLGNWREADGELENLAPELSSHPDVLLVRYEIYAKAEKWDLADKIAGELVQIRPQEAQFWIWHAYATRRRPGGGIPQAREILDRARQLIPKEPLISYNLGCYECQLGNLQAAWQWLEKAFHVGDEKLFTALALQDRDLEPLWGKIRQK